MDNDFFKDLYFGNYRPTEDMPRTEELKSLEEEFEDIKSKLIKVLDKDSLDLFLRFDEINLEMTDHHEVYAFSSGIKFATQLLYPSLTGKPVPVEKE